MKKISKNQKIFLWNAFGTSFNSFLSLFFLIIVTRINGIDESGLFSFYYSLSFTLQAIANYGGRIYQVSDTNNEFSFNNYLSSRYYTSLLTILIILIYCLYKNLPFNVVLIALFLITSRVIETFSDVIYGSFQKNNFLDMVGKSYTLKSILTLVLFLIIDLITHNLLLSTFGILLGSILVFIFYDLNKVKKFEIIKYSFNKNVFKKSKYIFYFGFITLFISSIPRFIGNDLLSSKNIGYLGIVMMIPTVMNLMGQFVIQPKIVELSNLLKHKKVDDFYKIINKICIILFSISIIISICAYTIGPFCLQLLYGLSFDKFRILFCVLVLAGTFNCLSNVYSNGLTILRKTKVQLYIYLSVLFVCYFISLYLTTKFSIQGLLTSYLLSMIIQYVLFVFVFKKYIKEVRK